jgi:hypothetical protein
MNDLSFRRKPESIESLMFQGLDTGFHRYDENK